MNRINFIALSKILLLVISVLVGSFSIAANTSVQAPTLTQKLKDKASESSRNANPQKSKVMLAAIEDLRLKQIDKKALQVGATLPAFQLPNTSGTLIYSENLLKKGPIVLVFYRGGWCPYCNLQLRDLQKNIVAFKDLGAQVVAISPQSPDSSLAANKKEKIDYEVLSDADNRYARKLGLVFNLPSDLIEVYKGAGIDLEKENLSKKWELPLSATYIINSKGKITFAFVDADYKKRAETQDLLAHIEKMKK